METQILQSILIVATAALNIETTTSRGLVKRMLSLQHCRCLEVRPHVSATPESSLAPATYQVHDLT